MPPSAVKTIKEIMFWQYAKNSIGIGSYGQEKLRNDNDIEINEIPGNKMATKNQIFGNLQIIQIIKIPQANSSKQNCLD